ncbi:MAG: receptor with intracellular metal dependent phosphohydrolase [Massilibacillus sp.]|jgi:putative nucleotidyltransferase with HDIG domain|nr:receptor with intracellular metal dependent phosphohydrolase [Massilibacillus sp.]
MVLGVVFLFLFLVVLSVDISSDKVDVEEGTVSDRDIIATRTVSYIDTAKTKKLEEEVVASVTPVYDLDVAVQGRAEDEVNNIFNALKAAEGSGTLVPNAKPSTDEVKQKLLTNLQYLNFNEETLNVLTGLDVTELSQAKDTTLAFLRRYLQRGVHGDEVATTKKYIAIEIDELNMSDHAKVVVKHLVNKLLMPNVILNVKETEKRKKTAVASVESVRETIRKGQVIVRRGDVITAAQINMMDEVGLHKGQVNEYHILGLTIFVIVVMSILLMFIYKFEHPIYVKDLLLVLIGLIMIIALCLAKVASYYSYFAGPIATGALLTAILIHPRVGMVASLALAMLFGVVVDYDLRAVAAALLGSTVGVYNVAKLAHGYSLTTTGILIAVVNFLVIGATGLMMQIESSELMLQCLLGVANGIGSAIITTGILPYLEHAFNITTPIKLLELGQSNHPLMQRLLLEAPGTYHHSVLLGNLAEAAADVIGADPVTVRVGAYYHDIGKIKRPYFFVENQFGGENPHDKLAPTLSTLIITSHIKDGLELCREYKLPRIISDIVAQHHGTLLASYFYHRATEGDHSECIIESDFRYEGPKPQTKEAALIMIADACEAAVRSISKPNSNRIEAMVRKIIRERLNDGQFDECNLMLRDLTEIGDVYIRILSSMFHSRIEYPDSIKEIERKNKQNGNSLKQLSNGADNSTEPRGNSEESNK